MMQLRGDHPIRHGFSAVGVRHGQHSGYHTGPCSGTRFPHLGISTEGTRWALNNAQERLSSIEEKLRSLEAKPDLIWHRPKYGKRLQDLPQPVTLRYGEDVRYAGDGRPTYAWEHQRQVAELTNIKEELNRALQAYEEVLATWSPERYPVTGAVKKTETTHMEMPRKNSREEEWLGILCRFTRKGVASDKLLKTKDPAEVTCKRCRTALGLP